MTGPSVGHITLHRRQDHYNGLVRVVENRLTKPRLLYDSDTLKSLQPIITRISRSARKSLFLLDIWKPCHHARSGTRAGRNTHWEIEVKITKKRNENIRFASGVNSDNLIVTTKRDTVINSDKSINLTLLIARSVMGKLLNLSEYISDRCVDILAITETWLREGDDAHINDLCTPGYKYTGVPRPRSKGTRGGGVGFVIRANLDVVPTPRPDFNTVESCIIRLNGKHPVHYCLGVSPPTFPEKWFHRSRVLPGDGALSVSSMYVGSR